MIMYLTALLNVFLVSLFSPLCVGIIRKLKARMQNRRGASVLQPYRELSKLFKKGEVISEDASWVFRLAPYLVFAVSLCVAAGLPILPGLIGFSVTGDFLVVVYLLALSTFVLALAALDTGNPFGGLGATREMTLAALVEGGLIFSFLSLSLLAHSTGFGDIAATVNQLSIVAYVPVAIAFFGFIIALLAETSRYPFDNPATHLELTMIHEAAIIEYSGSRLALMEWGAANKLLIFLILAANLFFPWGDSISVGSLLVLLLKLLGMLFAIAFFESTTAKYRYFRLPDILITSFVIGLTAVFLVVIV